MTQSSSRPPASVEDLIAAIRAGFQAYQELYARYHPYLARLTERLISPELQTDLGTSGVVQEGFLKIWQSFPSFRGSTEAELRAWMRAILRNTLTSEQRRLEAGRRDRGRRQQRDACDLGLSACPDPDPTPCSQASQREQIERLRQAVRRLPDDQRLALLLHREHGLSDTQISAILNRTPAAVREARCRALARLRDQLGGNDE